MLGAAGNWTFLSEPKGMPGSFMGGKPLGIEMGAKTSFWMLGKKVLT
jgi:hypothetical protein